MRFSILVRIPNKTDLIPLDINDDSSDPLKCRDVIKEIFILLKVAGEKEALQEEHSKMVKGGMTLILTLSLAENGIRNGDIIELIEDFAKSNTNNEKQNHFLFAESTEVTKVDEKSDTNKDDTLMVPGRKIDFE